MLTANEYEEEIWKVSMLSGTLEIICSDHQRRCVTDEAIDLAQVTLGRVNNSFTYLLFHQIFIDHLLQVRPDMYLIVKTCHYLIGPVCVSLQ